MHLYYTANVAVCKKSCFVYKHKHPAILIAMNNSDLLNQLSQQQQNGTLDQSSLQSLLGGSNGGSLIPESLTQALTIGFIVINAVSILFLIAYIFGIVRKWKVQSAVLHMQKDLAEIKAHMISAAPTTAPVAEPAHVESVQEEPRKENESQS